MPGGSHIESLQNACGLKDPEAERADTNSHTRSAIIAVAGISIPIARLTVVAGIIIIVAGRIIGTRGAVGATRVVASLILVADDADILNVAFAPDEVLSVGRAA